MTSLSPSKAAKAAIAMEMQMNFPMIEKQSGTTCANYQVRQPQPQGCFYKEWDIKGVLSQPPTHSEKLGNNNFTFSIYLSAAGGRRDFVLVRG